MQLYDAFDVAMAYDKFDAATMILKDAGGLVSFSLTLTIRELARSSQ